LNCKRSVFTLRFELIVKVQYSFIENDFAALPYSARSPIKLNKAPTVTVSLAKADSLGNKERFNTIA